MNCLILSTGARAYVVYDGMRIYLDGVVWLMQSALRSATRNGAHFNGILSRGPLSHLLFEISGNGDYVTVTEYNGALG